MCVDVTIRAMAAQTMPTKQVRLTRVPEEALRIAKSKAVLEGVTLDEYLTALIVSALGKKR